MDILFIQPKWRGFGNRKKIKVAETRVHPLSVGIVAAVAARHNRDHRIAVVDEANAAIPYDGRFDLVGISVNTYTAPGAFEIADRFRAKGVPVILGGCHASLDPADCERHADAVLQGEAEHALPTLLDDLLAGDLKRRYTAPTVPDLAAVPIPDRRLFTHPGADAAFVQATRGCANVCRFCYLQDVSWGPHRKRPISAVIAELSALREPIVLFVDDNLFVDRAYGLELFRRMEPLKKHWWAQAPTTLAADAELLAAAVRAGCFSLSYGFQTVSHALLDGERIFQNRMDRYREIVRATQAHGILVDGTFIFGFDGDPPSIFDDTVAAVRAMNLDTYTFYLLTVYPGTALHARYRDEGRLVTADLGKYDWDHAIVRPAAMTPAELEAGVGRAYAALDAHYRRTFWRRALRHTRFLFRSPALARFLLSSGWPRDYGNAY